LSLIPCLELDFSNNNIYDSSRTGRENRAPDSPSLPESSMVENDGNGLRSPLPTKTWNYGVRLQSGHSCLFTYEGAYICKGEHRRVTSSDAIKRWRSRNRELVKSSPTVLLNFSSDLDMVEVHHSPISAHKRPEVGHFSCRVSQ
jgi:hypothetical protein